MSSAPSQPQLSLQARALVNRLQARLGSGIADLAASLLAAAEAAPLRASREWQLFWEEVDLEAERLRQHDDGQHHEQDANGTPASDPAHGTAPAAREPQQLIDGLRARVAALAHRLDA
ncbi:MAG: hypothetical protein EBZ51_07860 [Synechococcaceae bacterium WB9_2_112]|nr:hypothetical protein [Synechococcaceae bacterium WB9_2_112]